MGTNLPQNGSALLAYVISKLRPDVFSHPIWVYFGCKETSVHPKTIDKLLSVAKQQQKDDPGSACRILLICAAYQNCIGQRAEALKTMRHTLALAEQRSLAHELLWVTWGICAIYVQENDTKQAARYLQHLRSRLREQNEWMLVNFVESIEQALPWYNSTAIAGETALSLNRTNTGLVRITFDWLQHWGFFTWSSFPEFQAISGQHLHQAPEKNSSSEPIFSYQRWQRYCYTIKQVVRGELKLRWVLKDAPSQAGPERQHQIISSLPPNSHPLEISSSLSSQTHTQELLLARSTASLRAEEMFSRASLLVYCLGPFRVYQNEQPVEDWPSIKGKAVFKYLVTHRERPVIKDVLMDLFWPDIPADAARNNLNVAIYGLRQALRKTYPSYSHVLFLNDCYLLNPELQIWLDYEVFLGSINAARELEESGDLIASICEYSKAEALYQGDFLEEDRYENWLLPLRENLQTEYLSLLGHLHHHFFEKQDYQACIHLCRKMLAIDPSTEEAHRYLMRCFFERGQSYMALRQYYLCVEVLKEDLDIDPASATKELYEYIRRHS